VITHRILALAVSVSLSTCSAYSFEAADGPRRPQLTPTCSWSSGALIADGAGIGVGLVYLLASLALHDEARDGNSGARTASGMVAGVGTAVAVGYSLSLHHGLTVRNECESARAAHERWLVDHATAR
jgi:hypothetical protein